MDYSSSDDSLYRSARPAQPQGLREMPGVKESQDYKNIPTNPGAQASV